MAQLGSYILFHWEVAAHALTYVWCVSDYLWFPVYVYIHSHRPIVIHTVKAVRLCSLKHNDYSELEIQYSYHS